MSAIAQADSIKINNTRNRERRRVVWGVFWVTIALTVLHLPLLPGYYDWRITVQGVAFPPGLFLLVDIVDILYTLGMAALGVLVVSSQPGNRIGWLIALIGLGSAVLRLTGHYAFYAYIIDTSGNPEAVRFPLAEFAIWLQHWLWVSVIALESIAIALIFPNGRLPSRWWWIFVVAAAAWVAFGSFVIAFHPFIPIENYFVGSGFQLGNPYASQAVADLVAPVFFTFAPHFLNVIYALIVIANLSLVVRYIRADVQQRQQIKWFAYALVITGILFVVRNQFGAVNANEGFPLLLEITYLLAISTLPVILGIAIFQYRLWDIDTLINRTLVYATLTVVLVSVYLIVVVAVGSAMQTSDDLSLSILATMIVAASFQGLRERIQRSINRFMFGQRDEPQTVLLELSRQLQTAILPQELLEASVSTVARTLKIPYVAIAIRRGTDQTMQTESGTNKTPTRTFPLIYQNEAVGELVIGQRSPGEPLNRADLVVLEGIAQQLGAVVYAVRLQSDLQTARERLVMTREEERRRLRRDLHDGLGPALASLPLKVDAAIDLMAQDQQKSVSLLRDVKRQSQQLVADVRRVVHDLRPPALDELGLVEALRGALAQLRTHPNGLQITFSADDLPPNLPAAVEAATYRITMEATTNVIKHAQAQHCWITLQSAAHPLEMQITIEDDGVGLPPAVVPNVGLHSMRERAEELGGSFQIQPRPSGGTRITVSLPLSETSNVP